MMKDTIALTDVSTDQAGYGWIIDIDHVEDRHAEAVAGPRNINPVLYALLKKGQGEKFRMYDDDGNLYYEGRLLNADGYDACEGGFEPLDDYGTGNAGCTEIRYFERGEWRTL